MLIVEHVTIAPYHRRSNGQAEQFVDTFTEAELQQFLQVYQLTSNKNAHSAMTPTEMFARKIRPVFDKLIPQRKKSRTYGTKNWI